MSAYQEYSGMLLAGFCLVALLTSAWICRLTIGLAERHGLGHDETHGVQKNHARPVPRLGGIPVFVAIVAGLIVQARVTEMHVVETVFLLICLLPAFGIGVVEDVTRSAGVLVRLAFTMIAAALGWWLLGASLNRIDVGFIDAALAEYWPAAFALTLIAAGGVAHAVNIIDGCNGLTGFFCVVVLCSLGVVAGIVGDPLVLNVSLIAAASIAGFLIWNFPFGRIFMGDSGAYLAGFLIAELSILLVVRNPEVSPWFPLMLMVYPVWETLFSMYRRAVISRTSVGRPDALHLHQLIYRRIMRTGVPSDRDTEQVLANSFTSLYLWVLSLFCAVPAVLLWNHTVGLMLGCLAVITGYMVFYRRLVRFRTPKILVPRSAPRARVTRATALRRAEAEAETLEASTPEA